MSEPLDLDAALAELEIPTRDVIINGEKVPVKTAVPLIASTHMNRGDWLATLEAIMPPAAARYLAERIPDTREGGQVLLTLFRRLGVDLGESEASAGS